jgi:hypothetical protein
MQQILRQLKAEDPVAIKAELIKHGIAGLDVEKFCQAQNFEERFDCTLGAHESHRS